MGHTKWADLTGAGILDLGSVDTYGYWHTVVTDFGLSHAIDGLPYPRYVDLGWISPAEHDPDVGAGLSGDFAVDLRWLEFEQQTWDFHTLAVNIYGWEHILYSLRPGVVIDLYTFAP